MQTTIDQNVFVLKIVSHKLSIIKHHTPHLLFCSRAFLLLNLEVSLGGLALKDLKDGCV